MCVDQEKEAVCVEQCGEEEFALEWMEKVDDNQTVKDRRRLEVCRSDFGPNKEEKIERKKDTEKEQTTSNRKARNVSRNVDLNSWDTLAITERKLSLEKRHGFTTRTNYREGFSWYVQ
ncbi:hypothetical protein HAX54_033508 [Datura stramonium]|uniref:Uncharacterized protein n=1 Tax=Datura stramonium TaxID=4076 RepID=A0ABS8RMC0_DATST|nr:hypothetical protein [Datura stramonium]